MATLKEKINYITNQFSAGKPAIDGEASNEFLIGVISELAADETNYAEFKDSIPAIHKAAMEELRVSTQDSKHLLVSSMLKNSGITSTLKEENVTQKPIFVKFLLEKANELSTEKGNDLINKELGELMSHAFDEQNKRIEISSLLAVTHKCLTQATLAEDDIVNRYMASENFSGEDYAKLCGATLAFNDLKDLFDYDLTENQTNTLATSLKLIEKMQNEAMADPTSNVDDLILEAKLKYAKSFFSNDLDVEAQLHKVRAEASLEESAGMISGYDIGTPVKQTLKAQEENKADESKFDLMMSWEDKYNDYLKKLVNVRVMTSGDKFNKRFATHGFAPATANVFGDSIVSCDKFGSPTATLWNISPLTGTMKLSRDIRYDDAAGCQRAFTLAALNARRQGWDEIFLNHPGPDREAKEFIEQSFNAMITVGDYSFDAISVPRRYQYVLDKLILDAQAGTLENNLDVKEEVRNGPALKPEPVEEDTDVDNEVTPTPEKKDQPEQTAPKAGSEGQEATSSEKTVESPSSDTVIPSAFEQTDDLAFDLPKEDNKTTVPMDDFETARHEEMVAERDHDHLFDDSHLSNDRHEPHYDSPHFDYDEEHRQMADSYVPEEAGNFDYHSTEGIDYTIPDELKNDHKASVEKLEEGSTPKNDDNKQKGKIKFGR